MTEIAWGWVIGGGLLTAFFLAVLMSVNWALSQHKARCRRERLWREYVKGLRGEQQ